MAFDPSIYALKYYKVFNNERGEQVRLEILEKGASLSSDYPMEIGELCGLSLDVEGRSESIDIPIVKTTLTFSMVDTADMGDEHIPDTWDPNTGLPTSSHIRKHGNWQEFYTPDATKYLVRVSTAPRTGAQEKVRWRGYITPDSWEESLSYRGTITITARDGLGTLSEMPFDMYPDSNGMISARGLIRNAFSKASIPMDLYLAVDQDSYYDNCLKDADGHKLLNVYMNKVAFEDLTWYEALEAVLNSLGLVIRFADPNLFVVAFLRYLPHLDEDDDHIRDLNATVQFHGGNKILDPAYKSIVEKIDFGFEADKDIIAADYNTIFRDDERPTYFFQHVWRADEHNYQYTGFSAALHASMDYGDDGAWDTAGYPCFLDVSRYGVLQESLDAEGDDLKKYLFAAANADYSHEQNPRCPTFKKKMCSANCKLILEFAPNPATIFNENAVNDWTGQNGGKLAIMPAYRAHKISFYIRYQNKHSFAASTVYRYWNGTGWQETAPSTMLSYTWDEFKEAASSFEVYLADCPDVGKNGYLVFSLRGIDFRMYYPYSEALLYRSRGIFCRIKSVRFESQVKQNIESHTTTTNNQLNTACNVRLERNPKFGFLPQNVAMLFTESYKNAFFIYGGGGNNTIVPAPYKWRWKATEPLQPFPVLVAKQLLCYHAASEEILEGDCSTVGQWGMCHLIYQYKGVDHILQSGTLDFREGRFTTITIRGYKLYDDLFNY